MKNDKHLLAGIPYGTPGQRVQLVHVNEMEKMMEYQRLGYESQLAMICENFDARSLGSVVLGERVYMNGKRKGQRKGFYKNIDGGHRAQVVRDLFAIGKHDGWMLAIVQTNMEEEKEAELFVNYNTNRKVTGNDRAKARTCYANTEIAWEETVEAAGFSIDFRGPGFPVEETTSDNAIRQADKLLAAYKRFKSDLFSRALSLLMILWATNKGRPSAKSVPFVYRKGDLVYALCHIMRMTFTQSGKPLSFNQITWHLQHIEVMDLLTDANGKGSGSKGSRPSIIANGVADQLELRGVTVGNRPKMKGRQEFMFQGQVTVKAAA